MQRRTNPASRYVLAGLILVLLLPVLAALAAGALITGGVLVCTNLVRRGQKLLRRA